MDSDRDSIIEKVREAGVCGAGGGGFPTHVKISAKAEFVIANGAECEPLLSTDRYLMEHNSEEIVAALRMVLKVTGAKRAYLALKKKYSAGVESLNIAAGSTSDVKVVLLENYYPAGDEHELVFDILNRPVPEGGIPLDAGALVLNVNTLLHIYRAVTGPAPVTRRWVTVAGEVEDPFISEVPIGISAGELIDAARPRISDYVVLAGGPMMGCVSSRDFRITKLSGGILVLPPDHPVVIKQGMRLSTVSRRAKSMCDQCFDCTIVCPRYLLGHSLEPHRIMRRLFVAPENPVEHLTNSYLCSQCGLCNMFACPLELSPRALLKETKEALMREGVKNPHSKAPLSAHPERDFRRVSTARLMARLDIDKYETDFIAAEKVSATVVRIPLKQHAGFPAEPVVSKGQLVSEGELIAEIPENSLGARVHASISGTVTGLGPDLIEITA